MFALLPPEIQQAARDAYHLFLADPWSPALHAHELRGTHRGQYREGSISVRVTRRYRVIYFGDGDTNVWYRIGSHSDDNAFVGGR